MTENSLQFSRNLNFDEWESVGLELFRVQAAWQWWVGDWLNYGEKKYGQTYEQALAVTGKSIKTLQQAKYVAASYESSRRLEVSWNHHLSAASLTEDVREQVLAEAEEKGLPVKWVRSRVAEIKGLPAADPYLEDQLEDDEPELIGVAACEDDLPCPDEKAVAAFRKAENRLNVLRHIVAELEQSERNVLVEWLTESEV